MYAYGESAESAISIVEDFEVQLKVLFGLDLKPSSKKCLCVHGCPDTSAQPELKRVNFLKFLRSYVTRNGSIALDVK
eukprot:11099342-Karenia_brevis.AAC.1